MKKYNLTASQELTFIMEAKAGNQNARNYLFEFYLDDIIKNHNFGPLGQYPKKFGYSFNPKGKAFRDAAYDIFLQFVDAVDKFDPNLVNYDKKRKNNPFLNYFTNEMRYRALDGVRETETQNERFVNESDLYRATEGKYYDLDNFRNEDSCFDYSEEYIYNQSMQEATDKVLCILPQGSREHSFADTYLKQAEWKDNPMTDVAGAMGVSRNMVHKYKARALQRIRQKMGVTSINNFLA